MNNDFRWNKELIEQCLNNNNIEQINEIDISDRTGFMMACVWQPDLALKMLEYDNINFNIQNNQGYVAFMFACNHSPNLIIPMLENDKVDENIKNNNGKTGWDIAKEHNPESFKIYQTYLEHQKLKNHYNQKSSKSKRKTL